MGSWEPGELPDTAGWEEVEAEGTFHQGDLDVPAYVAECGPAKEPWGCVYWATPPPDACVATIRFHGKMKLTGGPGTLPCDTVAAFPRAVVIDQIFEIGCDIACAADDCTPPTAPCAFQP